MKAKDRSDRYSLGYSVKAVPELYLERLEIE